jgi:T-complex protein 1 subunit beta
MAIAVEDLANKVKGKKALAI